MNRRILVVALNPALDLTYELPRVDWAFSFIAAAYNLVRAPKLIAVTT